MPEKNLEENNYGNSQPVFPDGKPIDAGEFKMQSNLSASNQQHGISTNASELKPPKKGTEESSINTS